MEIWQTNASGRYMHPGDQHDAPLDPNFPGIGRTFTDDEGHYRFLTIRPGAYPWQNHPYAWRPAHIHFSLLGNAPVQRLVTQMYFPGDPMLALDPVYHGVPDAAARERMVCKLALDTGIEGVAPATRSTSSCTARSPRRWGSDMKAQRNPSQTIGPFFHVGLRLEGRAAA